MKKSDWSERMREMREGWRGEGREGGREGRREGGKEGEREGEIQICSYPTC